MEPKGGVTEPITAKLWMHPREPLVHYPRWSVTLYLTKTYPGLINRIALLIWADTGEVIYCQALGGGGISPELSLTMSSETLEPTISTEKDNKKPQWIQLYLH
jgi:hypothetical protein